MWQNGTGINAVNVSKVASLKIRKGAHPSFVHSTTRLPSSSLSVFLVIAPLCLLPVSLVLSKPSVLSSGLSGYVIAI